MIPSWSVPMPSSSSARIIPLDSTPRSLALLAASCRRASPRRAGPPRRSGPRRRWARRRRSATARPSPTSTRQTRQPVGVGVLPASSTRPTTKCSSAVTPWCSIARPRSRSCQPLRERDDVEPGPAVLVQPFQRDAHQARPWRLWARMYRFLPVLADEEFETALEAADVLVLNERPGVENMCVPSKLTSYFAAGRPVVAATADTGAAAEEVRAAGAGSFSSLRPELLLDAVSKLGSDKRHASQLGSDARHYAQVTYAQNIARTRYLAWVHAFQSNRVSCRG